MHCEPANQIFFNSTKILTVAHAVSKSLLTEEIVSDYEAKLWEGLYFIIWRHEFKILIFKTFEQIIREAISDVMIFYNNLSCSFEGGMTAKFLVDEARINKLIVLH